MNTPLTGLALGLQNLPPEVLDELFEDLMCSGYVVGSPGWRARYNLAESDKSVDLRGVKRHVLE